MKPLLTFLAMLLLVAGCGGPSAVAARSFDAAAQAWLQENPSAAQGLYDSAIEGGGQAPESQAAALAAKGDYLLRHDDTESAKAVYAEAAALAPRHPAVLGGQGDAALVTGDAEAALEYYEAALRADPHYAPAMVGLGMVALQANDVAGAQEWLKGAIAEDAVDFEPGVIAAYSQLIAQDALLAGPFEAWLETYLQEHPEDLRSHALAGKYYLGRELHDQALTAWAWVVRKRPDYPGIAAALAQLHYQQGQFLEAIRIYQQLHDAAPSAELLHLLALSHANVPDLENALALFRQGEEKYPGDYRFTLGRGQVLYSMGELDAAYDVLRPLAEGGVTYFEVNRELGMIEMGRGNWNAASAWIGEALAIQPFDEWANFQAAVLAARNGQREAYEQHMQRVLERGYVTRQSLSLFDNYDLLMEIDWAAEWVDKRLLVTRGEGR